MIEKEKEKTNILEKRGGKSDHFEKENEKSDRFEKESETSNHLQKKCEYDKSFKNVDIQSEKEREGDTSVEYIEANLVSGLISLNDAELYRKFLIRRSKG